MASLNKAFLAAFFCFAAATILPRHSEGQQSTSQLDRRTEQEPRIRIAVDLVSVDVRVTNARGDFLGDLKRENFRVLEDGAERPITHFASSEEPAMVLVLVETSPAVILIHRQYLAAGRALLDGLAEKDWVALAAYDQSARVVQIFTQDRRDVLTELAGLRFNLGASELYFLQSVSTALDWLQAVPGRKALVLLTTGLDTEQPRQWDGLAEKLRASEVVVFPVALGGTLREFRETKKSAGGETAALSFEQADRDLEEAARLTGGHAYFPKKAKDFESIYREISAAVRHTYNLGFAPVARDGRFHKIDVQIVDAKGRVTAPAENPKRGYQIHARQGYVAPQP